MKIIYLLPLLVISFMIQGCSPKVGSQEWCESMKDKSNEEWTPNDTMAFMKSCNVSDLTGK